jgi:hypothetical protein
MDAFLKNLRKRPGLYFGTSEQPFTRFVAFMDGYAVGYAMARKLDTAWPEALVPPGFDGFARRRLRAKPGEDSKGWRTRIRERTASEEEAFHLLLDLLEEYRRKKK